MTPAQLDHLKLRNLAEQELESILAAFPLESLNDEMRDRSGSGTSQADQPTKSK